MRFFVRLILRMQLKKVPFSYMWILEKSIGKAKTILDLGTADGALMEVLSKGHKWNITGIDIYDKWLKLAEKKKVYKELKKGDLNPICKKFIRKKRKFDVVFCSQTIEHINRKKGEELLDLSEKLAKKRIVFGTPRGYMYQPKEFLGENPYQRHKSGWKEEDFLKRGYRVYGIGFRPVWSEEGLARTRNKLAHFIYTFISFIFAPLVYFYPNLGAGILCVKDVKK